MYHPLISHDIERVREEFGEGVIMSEAQKAALASVTTKPIRKVKIKGTPYILVPTEGNKFDILADDGTGKPTGNKLGEIGAQDGNPNPKTIKFFKQ